MSCAPGGRLQSVPVLRRPSQGLRFSRQTRRRAPEAGSSGGDNPGAAEAWVGLLLLKIGSAVFWEAAWRSNRGLMWLLARVDQHHPAPIHTCDFRAGREGLPRRSAGGSAARLLGHLLGRSFSFRDNPAPGCGVWPARASAAPKALWRARRGPVSVPERVLLPLDLNAQACVARPGSVSRSWKAIGMFSMVSCTAWAIAGG